MMVLATNTIKEVQIMNDIELMELLPVDITNKTKTECIELFEDIYNSYITRTGADKLLNFVQKSDFYSAPASTRYHSCVETGLLRHSLLVMLCLLYKRKNPLWSDFLKEYSLETLILVSVFHDLCKTYFYVSSPKNVKVYKPDGDKSDAGGRYSWEVQMGWTVDDKYPLGHGEKSCYFLTKFMDLNIAEYSSIRWHMGYSLPKDDYITLGNAIDSNPLLLALHEADLEASHLFEKDEKKNGN